MYRTYSNVLAVFGDALWPQNAQTNGALFQIVSQSAYQIRPRWHHTANCRYKKKIPHAENPINAARRAQGIHRSQICCSCRLLPKIGERTAKKTCESRCARLLPFSRGELAAQTYRCHHMFHPEKKSLPLSSTRTKAGKFSTSIFQTASMPKSSNSTTSTFLMFSLANTAAAPPMLPK